MSGETIIIDVVLETDGTTHQLKVDEYTQISDLASLIQDASLTEHVTMCRFADHVMDNHSTLNGNGVKTGALISIDIDFESEKELQEQAVHEARQKRQAEFAALKERRTLLNELMNMLESGVFADLNRRSDHIGATMLLCKGGIEVPFSRFLLILSFGLLSVGVVGAIWMLKTGIEYGGDDCDWSTRNHVGLVSACIYTYGLMMMHVAGPNYVAPCLMNCQGTGAWFRIMNVSALAIIFPVLQWGWVVWGQDETDCDNYMKNVKIAFYISAMSVFFVTFITPLLRQRYMRNCELTIITEQEAVQHAIDNSEMEYYLDIVCLADESENNIRIRMQIDHSSKVEHVLSTVDTILTDEDGFEDLISSQAVFQVCAKETADLESLDIGEAEDLQPYVRQLLAFDYVVHRIDELTSWNEGEEFHSALVIIDFATLGSQQPWFDSATWREFLESLEDTRLIESDDCMHRGSQVGIGDPVGNPLEVVAPVE